MKRIVEGDEEDKINEVICGDMCRCVSVEVNVMCGCVSGASDSRPRPANNELDTPVKVVTTHTIELLVHLNNHTQSCWNNVVPSNANHYEQEHYYHCIIIVTHWKLCRSSIYYQ